uniref:Uncharacterized protein n=1 Tax=Populus trichocarpa TaxID=3694 RepID=A0A3N7FG63_POPTR
MFRQLMFQLVSPLTKGVFRLLGRSSQLIGACLLALFCLFKGVCSHCFLVVQGSLFLWFSFLQAWHAYGQFKGVCSRCFLFPASLS